MAEATIQVVARRAGVSAASVSNFLNGRHDKLGLDTRERIREAVAALDYTRNAAARQLKTGRAHMFGVLVPTVANPFFGELAVALEQEALALGYRVLLCNTLRDRDREREFAQELVASGVRGIVTASASANPSDLDGLARRGAAVVAFDVRRADLASDTIDVVSMDNATATALAVRHLAELGHRRIAYVTVSGTTLNRVMRRRGFEEEIARHGGVSGSVHVADASALPGAYGDVDLADLGRRIAPEIAAAAPRPTAVVTVNDMTAIGLVAGLRHLGIEVPADMSLVGIDDIGLSQLVTPALTTVRQPLKDMAAASVERLVARLNGDSQPSVEMLFPPTLTVRRSTAPPPRAQDAVLTRGRAKQRG